MMLGDLDSYMQKQKEAWPPTYTIHKNKFKVDKRLKYKLWHHKSPRGEHRQENLRYSTQQYFCQHVPYIKRYKGKNQQMGPHQIKNNSHNSILRRQTTQLKNRQKTWTDTCPRRTHRGPRDIWKGVQHHQPSERCKLKPQWDTTSHRSEWLS